MSIHAGSNPGTAHSLTVGEGFVNPLGFHNPKPSFSWQLPNNTKHQTAYRITLNACDRDWDSGWVESEQSVFVPYTGTPFRSRERVLWRVNLRDEIGRETGWSQPANFELGLLGRQDWHADWIRPRSNSGNNVEPVAYLRRSFTLDSGVARARLYVTARGLYTLSLNNQPVADDYFANGWTSYHKRLDTLTYNVTDQFMLGANHIYATLGMGWYAGRVGMGKGSGFYGPEPEFLLQLEITHKDNTHRVITTDRHWQGTWHGPVTSSSQFDGEHYDARIPNTGWQPVSLNTDLGSAAILPKPFPPVRVTERLTPHTITEPLPGRFVFDLGQNMVGWARINMPMIKNQPVTLRFAEMLNRDGTLYTENLRSAKATDSYTAHQDGPTQWEPQFTFHGFRYVELTGLNKHDRPEPDWVTGIVLHTDLDRIGLFESSHAKLNQLQSNITWGLRGNFVDIPTDCPQRDERKGWTGDAQVFCSTSMFNYNCHAFWKSWLRSLRDDQYPDGRIPHIAPDLQIGGGSPGWMDAATIIPWEVYVRTGDTGVLADNLAMMKRLVGWYRDQATDNLIPEVEAFGDWLQPHAGTDRGETPSALLATAYYAHSTRLLADSCRVICDADEANRFTAEYENVRSAFSAHYFDHDAKIRNAPKTQTAYLLAIAFELIPDAIRSKAAESLTQLVREANGHLRTGFLGTPYILSTLDRVGRPDLAACLLFKETYPSWFYSINQGATTMWERWNSFSHEDGFGNPEMNSFNHYAYGAVGQWLYERVAGLTPDPRHPGYKHFFIRPLIIDQLDYARAELQTPYGKAASAWHKIDNKVVLELIVPPNTTATILSPNRDDLQTVNAGIYTVQLDYHHMLHER